MFRRHVLKRAATVFKGLEQAQRKSHSQTKSLQRVTASQLHRLVEAFQLYRTNPLIRTNLNRQSNLHFDLLSRFVRRRRVQP